VRPDVDELIMAGEKTLGEASAGIMIDPVASDDELIVDSERFCFFNWAYVSF